MNNHNGATGLIAAIGFATVFGLAVSFGVKDDRFGADGRYDRWITNQQNPKAELNSEPSIRTKIQNTVNNPNSPGRRNDIHIRTERSKFMQENYP